ncbi:MAG TPA: hypothetical protein VFB72_19055 [Verrucomicrobiae bacterium]|nr:hypothetical protein [Verrucomicrobiae bacterium]
MGPVSLGLGFAQGRKQQGSEDGNDCNDHQQFNQGKAMPVDRKEVSAVAVRTQKQIHHQLRRYQKIKAGTSELGRVYKRQLEADGCRTEALLS